MFHRHVSALVPTTIFVLLWSSGAIVSEIGLQYGSPLALLITRYAIAFIALSAFAIRNGQLLLARGSRIRVAITGMLIAGLYSACYLLALDHGVTPGALATLLGIQPILTIVLTERAVSLQRLLGLLLAFGGLGLVAWDGIAGMRFGVAGLGFAALSLAGITFGSILQKRETQAPWIVLPLQYGVGLAFASILLAFMPLRAAPVAGFIIPAIWLGLVISMGATFLLYRLIAGGNLVNVTSLFYLVPAVTSLMDWIILGNPMESMSLIGLALTILGLIFVFRERRA
jgi:drug/metabolite transporter (DMT)-like permease